MSVRVQIRHDLPRPTSIVRSELGDTLVEAYAGPGAGLQTLKASEWEPFIRTMPHSEFPSASACLCQVECAKNMCREMATVCTGQFECTDAVWGAWVPWGMRVSPTVGKHRRRWAPLILLGNVPSLGFQVFAEQVAYSLGEDTIDPPLTFDVGGVVLEFDSWSEIAKICGESRVWGGMHFAVGQTKCSFHLAISGVYPVSPLPRRHVCSHTDHGRDALGTCLGQKHMRQSVASIYDPVMPRSF